MATPQWEDGGFTGEVGDPSFRLVGRRSQGFSKALMVVAGLLDDAAFAISWRRTEAIVGQRRFGGRWSSNCGWRAGVDRGAATVLRRSFVSSPGAKEHIHQSQGAGCLNGSREEARSAGSKGVRRRRWGLGDDIKAGGCCAWTDGQFRRRRGSALANSASLQGNRPAARRAIARRNRSRKYSAWARSFYLGWWHPYMKLLFSQYEIPQCYVTYPAMPFIIENDYVAMSMNDSSFHFKRPARDFDARRAIARRKGARDDIDNIEAARRLQIASDRVTRRCRRAFDDRKLALFRPARIGQIRGGIGLRRTRASHDSIGWTTTPVGEGQ